MLKINKKLEYSLIILSYFEGQKKEAVIAVKDLCNNTKLPYNLAAKIMQHLSQKGLFASIQGPSGGYVLKQNLKKLSLLELQTVVVGEQVLVNCFKKNQEGCFGGLSCMIMPSMKILDEKIKNFYKSISIFDLLHKKS